MQIFAFPDRNIVKVHGPDAFEFLQRMVTQDLNLLNHQAAVYACLFTAQGRYHFDFIIFKQGDNYCLDSTRAYDLAERLEFYKLRMNADISVDPDINVYASFEEGDFKDPRHDGLGFRLYSKPGDAEVADFSIWEQKRIECGVFDGEQDAEIERSNADELHINYINGIDWDKGCYLGQELTARMRYRSGGKKHLYIIEGDDLPAPGEKLGSSGVMRSKLGSIGLALLRDSEIKDLTYKVRKING